MSIGIPKAAKRTPITSPPKLDQQVAHYKHLLEKQAEQWAPAQKSIDAYIAEAQKPLQVGNRVLTPFAPFRSEYSALKSITPGQIVTLLCLALGVIAGIYYTGLGFVIGLLAAVMIFYLGDMMFSCFLALRGLQASTGEQISDDLVYALEEAQWPSYTVLCPLYHEAAVTPQLVQAMQRLDYPVEKLQVLILIQDDDPETLAALRREHLPPHIQIVILPEGNPRTKPRACNYGLLHATGEYVVIYDAEDVPEPLQLKKAILTFLNYSPKVACVQAKLSMYNSYQNVMTRWFTTDGAVWFDITLPGLQSVGLPIPLGGTSNHFRITALREVGAWDAFNVTEDCDLGLRLAHYGYKAVMLDSTTYEEANPHALSWLRQRSRWIKGYMQTYLVNMRAPWRYLRPRLWQQFIALQFLIGAKSAVLLINPLVWTMSWIYIVFRPFVEDFYHTLIPTPVLYIGTITLIFGNFFYIYSNVLNCLRLRRYHFIKWALLSPLYWAMIGPAAYIALFELIFRPHYWSKTNHGLHLQQEAEEECVDELTLLAEVPTQSLLPSALALNNELADEDTPTAPLHALKKEHHLNMLAATKTVSLQSLAASRRTLPEHIASVFKYVNDETALHTRLKAERLQMSTPPRDNLLRLLLLIGSVTGLLAVYYFFLQRQLLSYEDAQTHLLIARHIVDSARPGLGQLGGIWLPLPHMLMLPFSLNDYLWHTGLAGACVSFPCYLLSCRYIYLATRRVTQNRVVSFLGTLLFALNLNVLYLQATPLTEMLLIALTTIACYHFLAWAQDNIQFHLILAALATCLATLTRYDGWFLFICMLAGLVLVCLLREEQWSHIEGKVLAFSALGSLGILLWLIWNAAIFGSPFYFLQGIYSSQTDQAFFIQQQHLPTYHNLWQSLATITEVSLRNVGLWISLLALCGLVVLLLQHRLQARHIGTLMFIAPFACYVIALYFGHETIFLRQGIFNVRYGAESIAPATFFTALLAGYLCKNLASPQYRNRLISIALLPIREPLRLWNAIPQTTRRVAIGGVLLVAVVGQSTMTGMNGPITMLASISSGNCNPVSTIASFMTQHYSGGNILLDFHTSRQTGINFINIPYQNMIYEGSGALWQQALHKPASVAEWVVANPQDRDDLVTKQLDVTSPAFLSQYIALVQETHGTTLFHHKTDQALQIKNYNSSFSSTDQQCDRGNPQHLRPLASRRSDFQMGMIYPRQHGGNSYSPTDTQWRNELPVIRKQTGAQWLDITFAFSQIKLQDTEVHTDLLTPTPEAFSSGIQAAHAQGYHVFAAPLLFADPLHTALSVDYHWSGGIQFATMDEKQRWFDSYWQALEPYAEVAEREGVEQFSIGTELDKLANDPSTVELWETLIDRVASRYTGILTYNMNWTSVSEKPPLWLYHPRLDRIGISAYFGLVEESRRLTANELYTRWGERALRPLDAMSEKLQKPLVLTELGFNNRYNTGYWSWDPLIPGRPDPEEQALACDAAMQHIVNDPHIVGVFFWGWANVGTYTLRDTPSVATIHTWFTKI